MWGTKTPLAGMVLGASVLWTTTVSAQALPRPAEFYFDADTNTTRPVVALKGEGDAVVARLLKTVERDPRARAEAAQLARVAMAGGEVEAGKTFYDRALAGLDSGSGLWRPVLWNYGWDLFRAGEPTAALARWRELALTHGKKPAWVPPTLALALWTTDRKAEAVQWYAAAVRTEPQLWSRPANFPTLLPDWRAAEHATLAEVHAAWAANPPAWP